MDLAMIADKIVPFNQLDPVYLDRGTFFGDGVYEVIRSYDGKIFALDDHLERFARSLKAIGIESADINQVRTRVLDAFEQANIANAKIYFHITRGSAPRDHLPQPELKPNFFLTVTSLPDASPAQQQGIAVSTHPDWRWKRCDIKSLNLLANVLARQDAARKGCDEAILVDETGLITEGSGSAFFAVLGRTLRTAPLTANILPSITRKYILQAARKIGLAVIEESLTPQQAGVTTKDIVPVVRFDGQTIANGKPGPKTKALISAFQHFTH